MSILKNPERHIIEVFRHAKFVYFHQSFGMQHFPYRMQHAAIDCRRVFLYNDGKD